jgi:hypothetical protein
VIGRARGGGEPVALDAKEAHVFKRFIAALMCACLVSQLIAPAAYATVNVNRGGDENPMKEVAKSVIYGGLAGVVLGSAVAVATKGNSSDGDAIRWGFAGGTFLGLGMGLWWVSRRPPASAALEFKHGELRAQLPTPTLGRDGRTRVALARVTF